MCILKRLPQRWRASGPRRGRLLERSLRRGDRSHRCSCWRMHRGHSLKPCVASRASDGVTTGCGCQARVFQIPHARTKPSTEQLGRNDGQCLSKGAKLNCPRCSEDHVCERAGGSVAPAASISRRGGHDCKEKRSLFRRRPYIARRGEFRCRTCSLYSSNNGTPSCGEANYVPPYSSFLSGFRKPRGTVCPWKIDIAMGGLTLRRSNLTNSMSNANSPSATGATLGGFPCRRSWSWMTMMPYAR
jgi:hypothetical protein